MIGSLSHRIRGAALEAIMDGTENITRQLLDTIDLDTIDLDNAAQNNQPPGHEPHYRGNPAVAPAGPALDRARRSNASSIALARTNHLRPSHLRRLLLNNRNRPYHSPST
jgi:hypothetical protein